MPHRYKYLFLLVLLSMFTIEFGCKEKTTTQHTEHEQQKNVYTCPMHPEIIKDAPVSCPICGMTLVKKGGTEKKKTELDLNTLLQPSNEFVVSSVPVTTIDKARQPVEVDALGSISYDTRQVGTISARYAGRIEKLYVRYRFQKVSKGQRIMDIYSPELMTSQQNLLFLLKNDAANTLLINASRQRLMLLGMTSSQVASIIRSGKPLLAVPVYSDYSGHIHEAITASSMVAAPQGAMRDITITTEELSLRPGMYIQKGQSLFSVYNPNKVWATLNIYTEMHMLVQKGDAVMIVPETAPAKKFSGKIDFIEPFFRQGSKTITARVYFDNSSLQVPIGSQVRGTIFSTIEKADWLPSTAIVSLGADKIVFIKQDGGFKAHKLITGLAYKDKIQVVSGLTMKDTVAQNAQFLTDSESFIKINQ
jgi:membrane fusion protein, copper/silver efflux system